MYVSIWNWIQKYKPKKIKLGIHGSQQHLVSTDGGGTWYPPQACRFLRLPHHK